MPLLLLGCVATARSQTSYDLTLTSEYAARGAALDTRPALQLRVEHDAETARYAGWYVGGFASPATIVGRAQGQLIAYAGRAQQLTSTLSWDVGVTRTAFTRDGALNYHEFYSSLAVQRASVRLFYSPAYYGEGRSAYLDLNGAWPLNERLRLALHAGLLHPIDDEGGAEANGGDVRIALGTDIGDVSVEAGWQVKAHAYLAGTPPARALTASASLRF
jgi:uncharacterized protein (TIGR02001 family)